MRRRATILRWAWTATAAVVLYAAAVTIVSVTTASADGTTQLQNARDRLANCQLLAASPTSNAQRTRAQQCVADEQRIIQLLTPTTTVPPTTTATTTAPATTTATTPPPTTAPPPPLPVYPNPASTGVPPGWVPVTTRTGGWTITAPGTYTDVRVTGTVLIGVDDVTLRRVEVIDGPIITETTSGCHHGTVLDQVTVRSSGSAPLDVSNGAVTPGGYVANRVKLQNVNEGFRAGGGSVGCGAVSITHSFALVRGGDCHCDGLQVYDGNGLTVDGLTVDWAVTVAGTTAFFAPSGEAAGGPVNVRHLLLKGGGFALTDAIPGSVDDYFYVAGSAAYGAMDVDCAVVSYANGHTGAIGADYQPVSSTALPCGGGVGQ
jgi:hypothetical protein